MEDRIHIYLSEFTKNAGIVGLKYLLEVAEAKEGISYGVGDDEQSLWLDRTFALESDWTQMYVTACVEYFETSTVYYSCLEKIELLMGKLQKEDWKADKQDKDNIKFINEKLLSNSYQSGFSNIKANIQNPEVYETLKKDKLKDKMNQTELLKRLESLQEFLVQPLCRETFVMKSVIYNYINRFWDGKSFLLRTNAKKDVKEVFELDFVEPLKNFWINEHKKAKDLCIDCGELMDSKEKVSIAFMKDAADDLTRKRSAFWNCNVDAFICPTCAFLYALAPLGFQLLGNKFVFINNNDSISTLLQVNAKYSKSGMNREKKDDEKIPTWFSRMLALILSEKEASMQNIQVILKSISDSEHYLFQIINKEIITLLQDEKIKDSLHTMEKHPIYKLNGEYINVYEECVFRILNYQNQYSFINFLMKQSLNSDCASAVIPAYFIYNIQLQCYLIREGKGEKGSMKAYYAMSKEGYKLRKELEKKATGNVDDSLRGTIYQLLNALSVRNWKKYIEIIIRLYCSCQVEMPSGFTRMINDDEEFQAYGYAFVLGLRGSYFETGKKDDENKQEESN